MDASSKDITDPVPASGDPPGGGAVPGPPPEEPASWDAVPADPADAGAVDAADEVREVLEVTRRRVDGLAGLDPSEMVGPAVEIADALGRLIEEDDR